LEKHELKQMIERRIPTTKEN